jgi:hypothetical protein
MIMRKVGIGFLGALSLVGCAVKAPPSEHLATEVASEIDPDCPYLRVQVIVGEYAEDTPLIGSRTRRRQDSLAEKLRGHLDRVGFKIVHETESTNWVLYSNSVELPNKRIFWSLSMQKIPAITDDGILLFRPGSVVTRGGRPIQFTSTSHLVVAEPDEIDDMMVEISNDFARKWLPSAQALCSDMNATLLKEEAELERVRGQLTDEIKRIQRLRSQQEKQLDVEVEQ